ncbi:SDR family oxidoreductase [Bdellovibrio sp. BCCA]|uniref:SDR family oxidoreductase n=1 Tax=Bdellovibrio sp. BCCA TaxID=3136281 RepID=UPI0030F227A1
MSTETLLVTGASGHLGKLVLDTLLKGPKRNIIATTRNPEKLNEYAKRGVTIRAADFNDASSLAEAFKGADRLLLISTDAIGSRIAQHKNAVEAAKKAGVKHIIYTSYPHPDKAPAAVAPEHFETEKMIQSSGLSYTFLRNNLYADNLLPALATALSMGAFAGTAGKGKTAYVTREDCANAAAGALSASYTQNTVTDVTGPRAVSYEDIAGIVSEIAGRSLPYIDMPESEFKQALMKSGLPETWADLFVSFDVTAKQGYANQVTSAVLELSGRAPKDIKDFLQENRQNILK